jgi:hypothetical protein
MSEYWPWLALVLLGAYHGINPAMGWLFAVALGLQERARGAVLRALPPIALGHLVSIGLVVLLVGVLQLFAEPRPLRLVAAGALIAFGVYKLLRPRSHPKWVGYRVGPRDLFAWSFLMSSAHGAGLMLVPVLFGLSGGGHDHHAHHAEPASTTTVAPFVLDAGAVAAHTLVMLVVMAAVALIVYEKVGVMILRRAWINLDQIWAGAVIVAGVFTLFT